MVFTLNFMQPEVYLLCPKTHYLAVDWARWMYMLCCWYLHSCISSWCSQRQLCCT